MMICLFILSLFPDQTCIFVEVEDASVVHCDLLEEGVKVVFRLNKIVV